MTSPVLSVEHLSVRFHTDRGTVHAVNDVSFDVYPGEFLGVVGESGSGKSVTMLSVLRLLPTPPAEIVAGEVRFNGRDLLQLPERELAAIRGRDIAMVFQDPMTSLNPLKRVGWQIAEAIRVHDPSVSARAAQERAIALLEQVEIPNAPQRYKQYPHEYSGGMRQRAMIAMAMANRPKVLIADEPTTALDVTVQAQVLDVLRRVQDETRSATVLVTHNLGLVAELADRVMVMYGGRVVEVGTVEDVFERPSHPYTIGLLASLPRLQIPVRRLDSIGGQPPSLLRLPAGCPFSPRCRLSPGRARCDNELPTLDVVDASPGKPVHTVRCHYSDEARSYAQEVHSRAEAGRAS